ncbi:MAG: GAF domain-containing protein [Armatimonadota bacterium]
MTAGGRTVVAFAVWALVFGTSAFLFAVWWQGAWAGNVLAVRYAPLLLAVWPILVTGAVGLCVLKDRARQGRPTHLRADALVSAVRGMCGAAVLGLSPDGVLQKLADSLTEEFPFDAAWAWAKPEDGEEPTLAAVAGHELLGRWGGAGGGEAKSCPAFLAEVLSGHQRHVVATDPKDLEAVGLPFRRRARWVLLGLPLTWHGKVIGALCAGLRGADQLEAEKHVEALELLAEIAAGSVAHAQLRERLEQEERHFAQVFEGMLAAGQAAMSGKDLYDVAKELIVQVRKTLGVDRASLWVLSADGRELQGLVGVAKDGPVRDERGWSVPMSKVDHPLVQCLESREISTGTDAYPSATAPLMIGSEKIGVLTVDNATSRLPLGPEVVRFLRVFAEHCALAVRNSQLLEARDKEAQFKGVTLTAITVAHQINNALVGVVSSAELLERASAGLDAKQVQLVRNIVQSGRQIAEFVRKLSNVTRIATVRYVGNVEMLDLAAASEQPTRQSGNGRNQQSGPGLG